MNYNIKKCKRKWKRGSTKTKLTGDKMMVDVQHDILKKIKKLFSRLN